MSAFKIVVTGPFNSGKTEFIKTISDIPVVSTERKSRRKIRGSRLKRQWLWIMVVYCWMAIRSILYGTPGQTRFDFMWEILSGEMNGFIVLVDSTDTPSFPDAVELIDLFSGFDNVPHLVVANKTDLERCGKAADVRRLTRVGDDITVMPCVARKNRASVRSCCKWLNSSKSKIRPNNPSHLRLPLSISSA